MIVLLLIIFEYTETVDTITVQTNRRELTINKHLRNK